jgi:uncharacterized OB-fold protein
MSDVAKPIPVPDDLSREFWRSAAAHVLSLQKCQNCSFFSYPPRLACTNCHVDPPDFAWEPVSGRGRLKTWTIMRDAFLPGFIPEVPYVVADVELVEQPGLRVVARLANISEDELALDLDLEVCFDDVADGISVPEFARASQ